MTPHGGGIESAQLDQMREVLSKRFGFADFIAGQQEVIGHLLSGQSAAAILPTSGGKSLCYQLPALMLPGLTLVVSPLIALMKDQIDTLRSRGIAARRLDSTLSPDEYRTTMDEVRSGVLRLLYVAPERFVNERFCQAIQQTRISLFAVDEAHCISEWGHNFRPDYLRLAKFAKLCRAERVLALTATATPQVLDDMCRFFAIEPSCAVRTGFYRRNLTMLSTPLSAGARDAVFLNRLRQRERGSTIVYVTLRKTAEAVAAQLDAAGFPARPYHAGMKDVERAEIQDWFIASQQGIVVATIAFGMGIDKANVRYVDHYNAPKSLENYAQEVGRAGRDGQPAVCEMFFCPEDLNVLENFIYGDTPAQQSVTDMLEHLLAAGSEFDVSVNDLSKTFDIRLTVVQTLLTYLELLGHTESGTSFYSTYRLKPLVSSAEMLSRFGGERRQFLAALLAQARQKKIWFEIDLDHAAKMLGESRDRAVRELDYLAEQGLLELQVANVRNRYRIVNKPADQQLLAQTLYDLLLLRESRELARLAQVAAWVEYDGCQVAALGAHFGDPLAERCGHCSWCLQGGKPNHAPSRPTPQIDPAIWRGGASLRREHAKELADPRSVAQFLCGVSSPWLKKAKLERHPLFGALSHVQFPAVLESAARG